MRATGKGLTRVGIRGQLILVAREGVGSSVYERPENPPSAEFLDEGDMDEVHGLEPWRGRAEVESWFGPDRKVIGVKQNGRLIARMCCDLGHFALPSHGRALEHDEVYLHSACVDPEHRGQNLAPYMREAGYDMLRAIGRTRFYSATEFFNYPARRFKQKLGAVDEALVIYVELFGRWSRAVTIRLGSVQGST